jgi:carboxymethylenebutenolidase
MSDDGWFPTSKQNQAEAVFARRKDTEAFVEYEFKVYKGPLATVVALEK